MRLNRRLNYTYYSIREGFGNTRSCTSQNENLCVPNLIAWERRRHWPQYPSGFAQRTAKRCRTHQAPFRRIPTNSLPFRSGGPSRGNDKTRIAWRMNNSAKGKSSHPLNSCGEARDPASGRPIEAISCLVGGVPARRCHLVDSASLRRPTTGLASFGDFCCHHRGHHHETATDGRDRFIRNCGDRALPGRSRSTRL